MGKEDFACPSRLDRGSAPRLQLAAADHRAVLPAWSFAFVAGSRRHRLPAADPAHCAGFSLAGILILGISGMRREGWRLSWRDAAVFAVLGVANNALYLGLGLYRPQDRIRRLWRL